MADFVDVVVALIYLNRGNRVSRLLLIILVQHLQSREFRQHLTLEGVRRRDRRLPRCALLDPINDETPWNKVYRSGNDQAMITITGLDYVSFDRLHLLFLPQFNGNSPYSADGNIRLVDTVDPETRGRPRKITARIVLALVLVWSRTKGSYILLQSFFGLTGTPAALWLSFGRKILLRDDDHADRDCRLETPCRYSPLSASPSFRRPTGRGLAL